MMQDRSVYLEPRSRVPLPRGRPDLQPESHCSEERIWALNLDKRRLPWDSHVEFYLAYADLGWGF